MRLILKEYIQSLKEKDELDFLLCDIFEQQGYVIDNRPKTGNRQFGVDIQLHTDVEILYVVVKQGDINRRVWDTDENAVRQSLNEIRDVTLKLLGPSDLAKQIRIIVASNGEIDGTVSPNWNGYVQANNKWCGHDLKIEFFGIDDIVKAVQKDFFNEYLFNSELRSLMRKALYFMDNDDYNNVYFEKVIDKIIMSFCDSESSTNKRKKGMTTLYMASQMIAQYAADADFSNRAISVTEYAVLRYWRYIKQAGLYEKKDVLELLIKLLHRYDHWNDIYISKAEMLVNGAARLPLYSNIVVNKVILYEILGYLLSYGNYLCEVNLEKAGRLLNIAIGIINKYPYSLYPPYDNSIYVIIMLVKLLQRNKRSDEINAIMVALAQSLIYWYRREHQYPAPKDSFEEALDISINEEGLNYSTSAFWGYYLLLVAKYNLKNIYNLIREFLSEDLCQVCKCVWFLHVQEEDVLYERDAMYRCGEGFALTVDDYDTFISSLHSILSQYEKEEFSFDTYSFGALEMLICHYYGYIPRVM